MAAIYVTEEVLRGHFNRDIEPHIDSGRFTVFHVDRKGPSHEPPGTVSRKTTLYEAGRAVATFHSYVRPDGTLGASGRRDPKGMQVGDDWLYTL